MSGFDFYQTKPWQAMPGVDPYSAPWKQGDLEIYMNEWFNFWEKLNNTEKQMYLETAPKEWQEYLDFIHRTQEE